ncbi:MAG: pilus assembly protein [Actinobacteria bacterium]|nr:pilus assembly protein [Actinomycetota bacterium]
MNRRVQESERGSFALETAVVAPFVLGIILLVVFAGRYALATQSVNSAASSAARTASIARTASDARSTAKTAAVLSLASQEISCNSVDVDVDTSGFKTEVGLPATVATTVTCRLDLSGLSVIGVPGSMTITADSSSPLDTYRERR